MSIEKNLQSVLLSAALSTRQPDANERQRSEDPTKSSVSPLLSKQLASRRKEAIRLQFLSRIPSHIIASGLLIRSVCLRRSRIVLSLAGHAPLVYHSASDSLFC